MCLLYGGTSLAIARGELRAAHTRAHADLARYAAALEGRPDAAMAALRRYLAFPTHPLLAQATRRQLGHLIGGDEGKALMPEADAFFRRGGAVDRERLANVLSPGFAASS